MRSAGSRAGRRCRCGRGWGSASASRVGQRAIALARDVRQGLDGVFLPAPVAAGAVDQLVEARADRPGGGEPAGQERRLRAGTSSVRSWISPSTEIVPSRRRSLSAARSAGGGDPAAPQRALVLLGQVRQQRQVVCLGTALHAELVVEAAVAFVGEVEWDVRERLVDHAGRRWNAHR